MAFKFLGAALILAFSQAAFAQDAEPGRQHAIGLFLPADATGQQGFIRIINNSDRSGEVKIYGVDDGGDTAIFLIILPDAEVAFGTVVSRI